MRNLPLKALQTFETVARHTNFQGAAQELFITPSAVSHQIKNLEEWLDCSLFSRHGNQLSLLPHGRQLASSLSSSLTEIKTACQLAKQATLSKKLVIAAIPSVATCWLIPKLNIFQAEHPDISLRVTYAIHGTDIDFSDVDIAFIFANSAPKIAGISTELFRSGKSYPVCSAELLRRHDLAADLSISGGPFLHDAVIADGWQEWFAKAGQQPNYSSGSLSFDDFNLLRSAALAGQGIALCPLAMIEDDLRTERLIKLSDTYVSENSGYYLLTKSNPLAPSLASINLFRDWVFDQGEPPYLSSSQRQPPLSKGIGT
ncbi:MAG: hypothetical protein OFPII_29620 [Osedax symbiont Rs1]|nr:MAG: hypothetical protein OFPII_29620 [Osedax symbiont Rs1]